ncbi:MAG: heme-binding protein [Clostridiales bacterium]|nr:heme-binding protein [Clostridiales bacterium]
MNNYIENSFSHLSDDVCDKLAAAARQKSEEMGIQVCFSIFDPDGVMRLFRRFGNAQIMSVKLTPAKAYTAAISGTPSEVFAKLAGMGQPLMDYTTIDHNFTPVSGGFPLMVGKECVGGIGVGGGIGDQDSQIAKYVVDTFNQIING